MINITEKSWFLKILRGKIESQMVTERTFSIIRILVFHPQAVQKRIAPAVIPAVIPDFSA
jgi:hypothetical protein